MIWTLPRRPDRIASHISRQIERALRHVKDADRLEVGTAATRDLPTRLADLTDQEPQDLPVNLATILHAILGIRPHGTYRPVGSRIKAAATQCECGATAFGADGEPVSRFSIDDARAYIAEVRWQFAKTMPQWPHEYTVRDWRPDLDDTFEAFAEFTRSEGVVKPWPRDSPTQRYHHHYVAIDGWDYWIMDDRAGDAEVINRARLDDAWQ